MTSSRDLRLFVSADGKLWHEKEHCGPESPNRHRVYNIVVAARQKSEKVWEDGVAWDKMRWDGEAALSGSDSAAEEHGEAAQASSTLSRTKALAPSLAPLTHARPPTPREESQTDNLASYDDNTHAPLSPRPLSPSHFHDVIMPGSVFDTRGNGHCGWEAILQQVLGRSVTLEEVVQFRRRVGCWLVTRGRQDLFDAVFPGGVEPTVAALDAFILWAPEAQHLDQRLHAEITEMLGQRLILVIEEAPGMAHRYEPSVDGTDAQGPVPRVRHAPCQERQAST